MEDLTPGQLTGKLTEQKYQGSMEQAAGKLSVMAGLLETGLLPSSMAEAYRDILSSRAARLEITL